MTRSRSKETKNALDVADVMASVDAASAMSVLHSAADILLALDMDGVIASCQANKDGFEPAKLPDWSGLPWIETVTVESRPKIEQLIQEARQGKPPRWRQVNHVIPGKSDLPVRYMVLRAGTGEGLIAIGRDMRLVADLQKRLVAAEQAIEQEYARQRQIETRYRLLMQLASEAILIIDSRNSRIVEANPAAAALLQRPLKKLLTSTLLDHFEGDDRDRMSGFVNQLRASGIADDVAVRLGDKREQAIVSGSVFRNDNIAHLLVRLSPLDSGTAGAVLPKAKSRVVRIVEELPDGFVVADSQRRILTANAAFLDLAQATAETQVRDEPLDRWLGRPGIDMDLIERGIRDNGNVRQFRTVIRGNYGTTDDVEVSGVFVADEQRPCYGFTIRRVARQAEGQAQIERVLPRSIEQLTQLVGRVPLKELVRETTDIIERLCIEAALQLNENNRASTADMLGLSRQSLYVKLSRYGITANEDFEA